MRVHHALIYSVTIVNIPKKGSFNLNESIDNILKYTQRLIFYMFLAANIGTSTA